MMASFPEIDDFEKVFVNELPLIDLRAPIEYSQGSFPNATNLPILLNDEREAVGICYKNKGQTAAIELGKQLVGGEVKEHRINQWLDFAKIHPAGVLFCFRGGLRSEIAQQWLADTGLFYPRIRGGYKAMRQWLARRLESLCANSHFLVLSGKTGSAKTRLIEEGLKTGSIPFSVDLEGLANHRGSAFGTRIAHQPTQSNFETNIATSLLKLQAFNFKSILIEDEGRFIGRCVLPSELHISKSRADWVWLEANLEDRVDHSYENYILSNFRELATHFNDEDLAFERFSEGLFLAGEKIQKRLGGLRHRALTKTMKAAMKSHEAGKPAHHKDWITLLLTEYYDPMYEHQIGLRENPPIFKGNYSEIRSFLLEY